MHNSLTDILLKEIKQFQPHTNCRLVVERIIEDAWNAGLLESLSLCRRGQERIKNSGENSLIMKLSEILKQSRRCGERYRTILKSKWCRRPSVSFNWFKVK